MKSVLITGCNRGIGLGLIRHLVKGKTPPKHLIATCRDINKATELQDIATNHSNLHILDLDVRNFEKYSLFTQKVEEIVGQDGLNVLINNAGMSHKFTRIGLVKPDQMLEAFQVNTIAPIMLSKALLPLLKTAATINADKPNGAEKALIVNISSTLGSINDNTSGGFYPYRCSKAALNMATKSLSVDVLKEDVLVFCIHPGWVKTNMGGTNAPLDVETSITGILNILKNASESYRGCFYQYDGKQLAW